MPKVTCCYFSGTRFEKLHVTHDGVLLATLDREEAIKAICLQIGALYVFNVNYEVSAEGEPLTGTSDYFDYLCIQFLGIRKKHVSSGNGVTLKKKRIPDPVLKLMQAVNDFHKKKQEK